METFTDAYDERVRPLMDKIDRVRSLLSSNEDGIVLPNVVVVGDQSSGKSTLLEALSLVELPKGTGIVTRCPLVLRLRKAHERKVYRLEGKDKKRLLDESTQNILKYIEEETQKLAGTNKNVVHELIELQVEDPHVRDLTVVDLPGIARVSIADQPKDIYAQTTSLIQKFIRLEGSVILCVFPANVDIATVESFNLAREVDPEGVRTIGVITKSDLAPKTEALVQQLLMDKQDVLRLKLGFVAVRNRSTDDNMSLEDARRREKEFFKESGMATKTGWDCLGIEALINRLADLYSDRVRETFPKIRSDVQSRLRDVMEKLAKFPPALDTSAVRLAKYHELAEFYIENFVKIHFEGSNDGKRVSLANNLDGKLNQFKTIVEKQSQEFETAAYRQEVAAALATCSGEQLPNFLSFAVLKRLINKKLDELWSTTEVVIHECFQATTVLLSHDHPKAYDGNILLKKLFPSFHNLLMIYLREKKAAVYHYLEEVLRLEKQEPYTLNTYYSQTIDTFRQYVAMKKNDPKATSNAMSSISNEDKVLFDAILKENQQMQDMLISIRSYWKVLTQRFMDNVSLAVRAGCIFDVSHDMRQRLRELPTKQVDFVDTYLAEDAVTRAQRKQLQQTKERLEAVDATLGDGFRMSGESMTATASLDADSTRSSLAELAAKVQYN